MAQYKIKQDVPQFDYDAELDHLNKSIKDLEKEFRVKEIDISFKEERLIFYSIQSSHDASNFLKEIIGKGLEVQEHFIVLYLNQANKVIGYYKHTIGTINSTLADPEMITAVALKTLAKGVIICHNHPSGNLTPSEPDKKITKDIGKGLSLFNISLLDHIIITRNGHYSFADNGEPLSGISKSETGKEEKALREEILRQLKKVTQANSPHLWKRLRTKEGYRNLEDQIIQRVIALQIVPAAIIPQMESEMDEVS